MSKRIHVVPHNQGWATRREGATHVSSVHPTQTAATQQARTNAIRERGEVIIHRPGKSGMPIPTGMIRIPPKARSTKWIL
jgi:hypothetical protein